MTRTRRKSPALRRRRRSVTPKKTARARLGSLEVQALESVRAELERLAQSGAPPRWNADPDDVRRSVAKLVLTLVEFIRQLLERQAIRRIAPEDLNLDLGPVGKDVTRARIILNPSSGREKATEHAELLNTRLRKKFDQVELVVTTGEGDAERAASVAAADGCDALFVAGGDGTLNEAMNGLASGGALERMVTGVVPLGTGNDFAAALGVPVDVEAALDVLLQGRELRVDLGDVNGRVFVNTSGGGFIAEVSVAVTPQLKTIAGRLAYLIGGAQTLLEFDPVQTTVVAEPGSRRFSGRLYAFAVCNSRLIGGGRLIAPVAVIDDGLLDLCLIEAMSALEFVGLARKVADGDHVNDPRVTYLQASSVRIDLDREVKVNTDGEVFEVRSCEYRVRPKAARFFAGDAPFAAGSPS